MFSFDPTHIQEIQTSQQGQISPAQAKLLQAEAGLNWLGLAVPVLILPAIFIGILAAMWFSDSDHQIPWLVYLIVLAIFGLIELLTLVPQVRNLINSIQVRSDLAAGQVETEDGHVVWRRNKYVPETPARRLSFLRLSGRLMPGPYRFYFLPNTGLVLSAARLNQPGDDPRVDLLVVLAQVNKFSTEDLDTNHQGRLAGSQLFRLVWKMFGYVVLWVFLECLGLPIGWSLYSEASVNGRLWVLAIGGVITLLVGLAFLRLIVLIGLDMVRGQVTMAQGPVRRTFTVTHSQHGSSTTYYYRLDKLSFTVSSAAYHAFLDGMQYRLYYSPLSKTLLAIEPL